MAAAHDGLPKKKRKVGVLAGPGNGDNARGQAICNALCGSRHMTFLTSFTGTMVEFDLAYAAKQAGTVDVHVVRQPVPREMVVARLLPRFDVLVDAVPYAVRVYSREDAENARRIEPFRIFYDGHPEMRALLRDRPYSVWDLAALTTGLEVSPGGVIAPLECAPWPTAEELEPFGEGAVDVLKTYAGCGAPGDIRLEGVGKYVTVHNGAGRHSRTKMAAPAVFEAIVQRLDARGVKCVQVGVKDEDTEPAIAGAVDRRGLRLPLTVEILRRGLTFVDVEGFLPIIAAGCNMLGVVLFGPTPPQTFGMEHNVNCIRLKNGRPPCPYGVCFARNDAWGDVCAAGHKYCANIPEPGEAADIVDYVVRHKLEMVA